MVDELFEQVKQILQHNERYSVDINLDDVKHEWDKNKNHWYKAFEDKMIYEHPEVISIPLSQDAKEMKFWNFIRDLNNAGYYDLSEFLRDQGMESFFENRVHHLRERCGNKIDVGQKIVKSFKYFISNKEYLENWQNKASQLIQENKITGKLCLSIHPFDYLTISENNYNWRSCHSLDGMYRAGNLSYMTDENTVVCYLKSEEDTQLKNFPEGIKWNNKKWRVLLYFSKDRKMMFASKQYPFEANGILDYILKILNNNEDMTPIKPDSHYYWREQAENYQWRPWTDARIKQPTIGGMKINLDYSYYPVNDRLIPLYELMQNPEDALHYNDVLFSHCYTKPMWTALTGTPYWIEDPEEKERRTFFATDGATRFSIGNEVKCLHCGKHSIIQSSDTYLCYECELKYGHSVNDTFGYCSCCNVRLALEEEAHWIDEEPVCEDCFNANAAQCDDCKEWQFQNDLIKCGDQYLCNYCYSRKEEYNG